MIDLTTPRRIFTVFTTVTRNGTKYMGERVKINAHNAGDAKQRVRDAGFEVNKHFEPEEAKE